MDTIRTQVDSSRMPDWVCFVRIEKINDLFYLTNLGSFEPIIQALVLPWSNFDFLNKLLKIILYRQTIIITHGSNYITKLETWNENTNKIHLEHVNDFVFAFKTV